VPRRMRAVERMLRGEARTEDVAMAAGALATEGAEPLAYNAYKIPLVANLVKRAVLGA